MPAIPPMRLSHTHDAIINWLIINPQASLRECADFFGYTQPWLSSLLHSGLFQAALKERQEQVHTRVVASIPERLAAVADVALDKLATCVEKSEDPDYILDATDRVLHRMGYAPASVRNPAGSPAGAGIYQQNNLQVNINARDLEDARSVLRGLGRPELGDNNSEAPGFGLATETQSFDRRFSADGDNNDALPAPSIQELEPIELIGLATETQPGALPPELEDLE